MALETFVNGEALSSVRTKINSNFSILEKTRFDKIVAVKTKSDLGDSVGGIITLNQDGIVYVFDTIVDLGSDRIEITGNGVKFEGNNAFSCGISTSTSGSAITISKTFVMEKMTIIDFGTESIKATNSGTDSIIIRDCAFVGAGTAVDATDYQDIVFSLCSFNDNNNSISLHGTMTNAIIDSCKFIDIGDTCINLNSCVSRAFSIDTNIAVLTGSSTFLDILPNSGNLLPDGAGTVLGNKIDNTLNGTLTTGYSPFDEQWTMLANNLIPNSDRLEPTGWGFYVDDALSVINVADVDTKVTVNALGANSNSDYLPIALQTESIELWDTSTNTINGVNVGDSYIFRLNVSINSINSNPKRITLRCDIGGSASPTIVVSEASQSLRSGGYPQVYSFAVPIFSLSTFVSNGMQLFLSTDTGTAEVGDRSIFIERHASGLK